MLAYVEVFAALTLIEVTLYAWKFEGVFSEKMRAPAHFIIVLVFMSNFNIMLKFNLFIKSLYLTAYLTFMPVNLIARQILFREILKAI